MSEYAGVIAFFLGLMLGGVWGFLSGLLWPGSRVWRVDARRCRRCDDAAGASGFCAWHEPMPKRLEL